MIKSRKQMYLVIGAFALVLMLGTVTYAFFNYTRTGSANIIRTGRIAFNSTQGQAINLTNVFPIDVTNGIPNNNANVGSVTINVTGDTTYGDGVEYLVSAVNVQNTIGSGANAKTVPISIDVSVSSNTENDPATTLGTADSDYFTHRGPSANTSIYKVLAGDVIANNDQLVVGYIKSGATGVDGNIVIRAYLDASKIAISDTYPEQTVRTVKTTGYSSSACETTLTGVANASTYCASASSLQSAIDNSDLSSVQITLLVNAGIVEEYTDGTTSSWVGDRTVFTTAEWNSLQTNGVSFQVKVESNEGTWVEEPATGTIESCPNCYFMYTTNEYNFGTNGSLISSIISNGDTYSRNYNDIKSLEYDEFLGFTISNDKIERAYACGLIGSNNSKSPYCLEVTENVSLNTQSNKDYIMSIFSSTFNSNNDLLCNDYNSYYSCEDSNYDEIYTCRFNTDGGSYADCIPSGESAAIIIWEDSQNEFSGIEIGNGWDRNCYANPSGNFYCYHD